MQIDELRRTDLELLGWSGDRLHLEAVGEALTRRDSGEVDYIVVRTADGCPLAKAGIDYAKIAGAATIWQVATHPDMRGQGFATALVREAERRIQQRGLVRAIVEVELGNNRARRLYESLGYRRTRQEVVSWPIVGEMGDEVIYRTTVEVMEKTL